MKKIIYIFIILFAFCSCAKDYPQQVKDRVEQYQKEGKKVLSHSDDPTGKEHYIVFADVKAQIIGVDTLGETVKEIHLGEKPTVSFEVKANENQGLRLVKIHKDSKENYSLNNEGKICRMFKGNCIETFDMKVFKDKYIIFVKGYDGIFLNDDDVYYSLSEEDMGDDGNLNMVFHNTIGMVLTEELQHYLNSSRDLYIDRYHDDLVFKATVSPEGKIIKQASSAYCSGAEIPVEMFSDWLTLRPYLAKVVQAQNEEERNSYDYAY